MRRLVALRRLVWSLVALLWALAPAAAAAADDWTAITNAARGQTVYWNAWGGDERINAYIAWVGDYVREEYSITLHQVKLADTADAVSRVLAERAAGKTTGGSVDLIWINGVDQKCPVRS